MISKPVYGDVTFAANKTVPRRRSVCACTLKNIGAHVEGRVSESQFRHAIVWLVGSRLAGTLLAQVLLVPSAALIVTVARAL